MILFATEFPVKPLSDRGAFVAQVISWLKGTSYSTVFDNPESVDLAGDAPLIYSSSGEELRLREFKNNGNLEAIGFRHDFPDGQGRLWRTEAVLRRSVSSDLQDLIRLRTQCIAREAGAHLDPPRKPYLIKSLLNDHWGGTDGELSVSDQPIWLDKDSAALKTAHAITLGQASYYLPIVYVSAIGPSKWVLSQDQIIKLAYDLGGIAHVAVEPYRAFSFQLRDLSDGENVYGGTIGIAIPSRGIVRRFFLGLRLNDANDLQEAVRSNAIAIRSQMPADGWDWTELQEQALRYQRERDQKRLNEDEIVSLYQEEVENLKDRIGQLEAQIAARAPEEAAEFDEGLLPPDFVKRLAPEIYPGEYSDRMRLAVRLCVIHAEKIGLDLRSKSALETISPHLPLSAELSGLKDSLKRATKESKRVASELTRLLARHGYREKSDNRHIRLQAKEGYLGLENLTLPKTPSDGRGLINLRKQIEHALGLERLSD
jgi:hypothetical protein